MARLLYVALILRCGTHDKSVCQACRARPDPRCGRLNALRGGGIEEGNHGDSARRDKALELAYQRACTNHEAISEFRVKLLGLLPLATGTVSLLLLRQQDPEHPEILQSLGPIGLLGLVVTVGLFAYELRGMQRCHRLEVQAGILEEQLGLSTEEGPFLGQPPRSLEGMLCPPAAGLIIYVATAFIWLYIAGYGFSWWMNPFQAGWLVPAYGIVLAVAWMLLSRWLPKPGAESTQ